MTLISITALVHIEDYGHPVDACARDYLDPGTITYNPSEVTILEWAEVPMVAIPQNTSDEPF